MASTRTARPPITPVQYQPPAGYELDLEVYPAAELRRRASTVERRFERVDFHVILHVTAGRYRHDVDFESHGLDGGSLLVIQPGQVHRFGDLAGWEGWLLIFRSELLQPAQVETPIADLELFRQVEGLPVQLRATGNARRAVREALERMADDAKGAASPALNALLRSQLHALLIRLHMLDVGPTHEGRIEAAVLDRFRSYRTAVEREYRRWHAVRQYAKHLGCSEKSLSRATREVADVSAKTFLTDRIVLEAKRLLAHTLSPVALIADQLGFDEPTNFVKFFRRETGLTPGAFRQRSR